MSSESVNKKLIERIKTPCVGICSTGIGDSVCRGCKRFAHEVIHWNSYNEQQKAIIDQRLTQFLTQIIDTKLQVFDAQLLHSQLEAQQIDYPRHKNPSIWAYYLLRAGASQIADITRFGVQLDAQYRDTSLTALRTAIDVEYYLLSEAHYDRYFQGEQTAARGDESGASLAE